MEHGRMVKVFFPDGSRPDAALFLVGTEDADEAKRLVRNQVVIGSKVEQVVIGSKVENVGRVSPQLLAAMGVTPRAVTRIMPNSKWKRRSITSIPKGGLPELSEDLVLKPGQARDARDWISWFGWGMPMLHCSFWSFGLWLNIVVGLFPADRAPPSGLKHHYKSIRLDLWKRTLILWMGRSPAAVGVLGKRSIFRRF
jgi:hypothetical protein